MSFLDVGLGVALSTAVSGQLPSISSVAASVAGASGNPVAIRATQNIFGVINAVEGLLFKEQPLDLAGGMTPQQALHMMQLIRKANPARRNLWFVRIIDPNPPQETGIASGVDPAGTIGLLATDVSYTDNGLQGSKTNVGSAVVDGVIGMDACDLTLTTLDDSAGTLKRWFRGKLDQVVNKDGTFGLPRDYCVTIEVIHGAPIEDVPQAKAAFRSSYRMRPTSLPLELSRKDHGQVELQLGFSQFDTFYSVK